MGRLERRSRRRERASAAPKGLPPAVQRAPSDDNERQLRRLVVFLEDATGFQLGLVTYDTPEVREEQLKRLAEHLHDSPVRLTRLDFTETPHEKQLLDRLRQHLDSLSVPEGKRPAVMVLGIEATLDYRQLGPGAREGMAILENANAQRDAFARHCLASVVLWLNPTAASMFALRAPDLWHWRSGTFRFTSSATARPEMERRLLGMSLLESDNLPRRAKLERIATLRDLLTEPGASPMAATPRGRQRRAAMLNELGLALLAVGDARAAISVLEEALGVAREVGDRRREGIALGNLGIAYADLGGAREAIGYYNQQLAVVREINDLRGEASSLRNIGTAYAELGDARKAIESFQKALAIERKIGDRRGESASLVNLANVYTDRGDPHKAIHYSEQAMLIAREIGDRRAEASALSNLGVAYAKLGNHRKGFGYFDQELAIVRELGDRRGEGSALGNLGIACAKLGDPWKAIQYHEAALAIERKIGNRLDQSASLGNVGYLWRILGKTEKAQRFFEEGLRLALLAGDRREAAWRAGQFARLYFDRGQIATAIALEAFAYSRFHAMESPQAETAARNLTHYRKEMGEAKFREALGRAEETVAAIFRELAGEPAAEMAAGIQEAFPASPLESERQLPVTPSMAKRAPDNERSDPTSVR